MTRPCILIPGIQGSSLQNAYSLDPSTTWSTFAVVESKFFVPDFATLALDPKGMADLDETTQMRANALFSLVYGTLLAGLRGRKTPTYLFPYDWRYSNALSADVLIGFVKRLQQKRVAGGDGKFDFVVHSMGGLVLRAMMQKWSATGETPPVGKVVFIATPHCGSLDAVEALISGEAVMLGGRKEMRKLLRTFPSVYELLPRFANAVVDQDGKPLDVFQEANWQENIAATKNPSGDFYIVQHHLSAAEQFLKGLPRVTLPAGDMLVIYGKRSEDSTKVKVIVRKDQQNWYDLDGAAVGPGDGTVPIQSALLPGVQSVEIHEDDVSYFHPVERGFAEANLHAFLPALDEVATVASRFLQGQRGVAILPKGMSNRWFATPPASVGCN